MAEESSLPQQIRTVERSVVFLRQEHLTLLHGLHLEILSLQKRCSGEEDGAALVPVDPAPPRQGNLLESQIPFATTTNSSQEIISHAASPQGPIYSLNPSPLFL